MEPSGRNLNFQLGLLHFAHLLTHFRGQADFVESNPLRVVRNEELIPDSVAEDFERTVSGKSNQEIFQIGLEMLNRCDEHQRRSAFLHLYRLTQSKQQIQVKEAKFLLHSMKSLNLFVEDLDLAPEMAVAQSGW